VILSTNKPEKEELHLDLQSYDYSLPEELIAQHPLRSRDSSRLLLVSRTNRSFADRKFRDLAELLQPGDLLVLNNTKVIPARLASDRGEVLLVRPGEENCWEVMVRPGKKFSPGQMVQFDHGIRAKVVSLTSIGRMLQFEGNVDSLIRSSGEMPLPPYIERESDESDRHSYQTIYARYPGSIAAPTAGLHFTCRTFKALKERGVSIMRLLLHVGPGTFQPVKSGDITKHHIHSEFYRCTRRAWEEISRAKRVIAVGTTTTRCLETIAATDVLEGYTDLFIYPGYQFRIVQGLITNFHLPKSSLLMLVSAFGGYELIRQAYLHAVSRQYRFYSYGDAMLIL
jgi:S-adenosylmethionine:tRNA ribosyltransferase-isomerase